MKNKKILALLLACTIMASGVPVYAADFSDGTAESVQDAESSLFGMEDSELTEDTMPAFADMEENADAKFYIGEGCPECHHSGYHGRQAVFEILTITKEMRQMIAKGATAEDIMKLAEKTDFVTMKESCRKLVSAGITSIEEAMKAINSTLE